MSSAASAPDGASAELAEIALERAGRAARTYDDGVKIIEEAARLTGLGRNILDQSESMMACGHICLP
jgi:hypothetical protein